MRGAPRLRARSSQPMGIIPADAGSTSQTRIFHRMRRDHPRGCGEHMIGLVPWHVAQGSSPRMRGALIFFVVGVVCLGIIPADAGSTVQPPAASARRPGSSPRMRGARYWRVNNGIRTGIIPADAGSTIDRHCRILLPKDHPRGCGEHNSFISISKVRLGSSPRMRGALSMAGTSAVLSRIIPADAGSTWLRSA